MTHEKYIKLKSQCLQLKMPRKKVWPFVDTLSMAVFEFQRQSCGVVTDCMTCKMKNIYYLAIYRKVLQNHTSVLDMKFQPFNYSRRWLLFSFFWLHWVFIVCGLSLVVASGGYFLVVLSGFSLQWLLLLCRAQTLEHVGFRSFGLWA